MLKKYIFVLMFSCATMSAFATEFSEQNENSDDASELLQFDDIFDDEEDQAALRKINIEEAEVSALEEFAEEPTIPSETTIMLQQLGVKIVLGYLAMKDYIESWWSTTKRSVTRFKAWVLREQID